MKKLAIILLSCIYALSVFSMAPASMYCCEKAAFSDAAGILPNENNTDNCCNNPEQGVTNITHHLGAATVHISHRSHTASLHAGITQNATSLLPQALHTATLKYAESTCFKAVPLYRLHCVYRI